MAGQERLHAAFFEHGAVMQAASGFGASKKAYTTETGSVV
jgi:hypothetical protein